MIKVNDTSDQSSELPSNITEDVKREADDLASDLIDIVGPYFDIDDNSQAVDLITELCIYIAERDTKVMIHGYNVGKRGEI